MKEISQADILLAIGLAGVRCDSLASRLGAEQTDVEPIVQQLLRMKKIAVMNGQYVRVCDAAKYYEDNIPGHVKMEYRTFKGQLKALEEIDRQEKLLSPPPKKRKSVSSPCDNCRAPKRVHGRRLCPRCYTISVLSRTEHGTYLLSLPDSRWGNNEKRKAAVRRARTLSKNVGIPFMEAFKAVWEETRYGGPTLPPKTAPAPSQELTGCPKSTAELLEYLGVWKE